MTTKKLQLVIIGAGPMGRETYQYAIESIPDVAVRGFLDGRRGILDGFEGYPVILSSVDDYRICEDDVFVCALGDPAQRRHYVEAILCQGGEFISIIHPRAYIGRNVSIGKGCTIAPSAVVTCEVKIGDHVIVNVQSSISHDCILADYVTLSPGCHLPGGCRLGEGVFMGAHSTLIPNVCLADGVYVAAGAVVIDSGVAPNSRLMGIPAKRKVDLCTAKEMI